VIELDASEGTLPAYVHENACDGPDPAPTDRLEAVVNGRSETVIPVSFQHLRTSPHAIIVYRSVDEYAACGTVGSTADRLLDG
jgi:hypothetical protein